MKNLRKEKMVEIKWNKMYTEIITKEVCGALYDIETDESDLLKRQINNYKAYINGNIKEYKRIEE